MGRLAWVCLALGWLTFGCLTADCLARAPSGQIVAAVRTWEGEYFSRDIPGGVESSPAQGAIYTLDLATGAAKQIVGPELGANHPTFSPDGSWIYFQAGMPGQSDVYRCRTDGSELANLTQDQRPGRHWQQAYGYVLSRDGGQLLYTVHDGQAGRLALARADGSQPRLLYPDYGYVYMGALSPDGRQVIASGPARDYRLLIGEVDAAEPRVLTPDHPDSYAPQFTPDGRTIVFCRRDGDVYRVESDGSHVQRLTEGAGYVEFRLSPQDRHGSTDGPQVSPDGRHIAYLALVQGVPQVWTMRLDGGEQRQLTFGESPCGRVRWGPDGRQLAFVRFVGKYPQLFVAALDTARDDPPGLAAVGEPEQVADLPGAVYLYDWRP